MLNFVNTCFCKPNMEVWEIYGWRKYRRDATCCLWWLWQKISATRCLTKWFVYRNLLSESNMSLTDRRQYWWTDFGQSDPYICSYVKVTYKYMQILGHILDSKEHYNHTYFRQFLQFEGWKSKKLNFYVAFLKDALAVSFISIACGYFCFILGWLVVLRMNIALVIIQPYWDFEAGDNQSLKS